MLKDNRKIRVIIYDDNVNVRQSIEMLISVTNNMELAGAFASGKHLLDDIRKTNPDIVLMDIDMPGISGIEAVKLLRSKYPDLPVLMLTGFEDDEKVFNSIVAGANGYILKSVKLESLIHYIEDVSSGGAPMSPVVARKVLTQFARVHPASDNHEDYHLSAREKQVLQELVKGRSYKFIAAELNISYETVHSHIRRIYQKLQVNSVGEAISKTLQQQLLK